MDIGELFDDNGILKSVDELTDKAKAAISSVKVTERTYGKDDRETTEKTTDIRLWDKGKALVELGKHFGIFEKDNNQKRLDVVVMPAVVINGNTFELKVGQEVKASTED